MHKCRRQISPQLHSCCQHLVTTDKVSKCTENPAPLPPREDAHKKTCLLFNDGLIGHVIIRLLLVDINELQRWVVTIDPQAIYQRVRFFKVTEHSCVLLHQDKYVCQSFKVILS